MPVHELHICQCPACHDGEQQLHHEMNLFVSRLDERQRRWFAALESRWLGESQVARITGIDPKTIRRGRRELEAHLEGMPEGRIRAPGAGRPAVERQDPSIEEALVELLEPETAGMPMATVLYKRSSLRNLRDRLKAEGHAASHPTVSRLLRKLGYSPRANVRRKEAKVSPPEREAQFAHIEALKHEFLDAGEPVISVDSKKKRTRR